MNKRLAVLLITLLFLLTITDMTATSKQIETKNIISTSNKCIIYVDDDNTDGPWDGTTDHPYQYIQDGVLNATEWSIIYVFSGIYYENVIVDKTLTLLGENRSSTIIDGMYGKVIIHITADYVNITNFTIRNSGGHMHNAGIKVSSENNSIVECTIYRTKTGIYVNNTHNNDINNCTFHTSGEGIFLKTSASNNIRDCCFYHNAIGVHLQDSYMIEISNSYAHTNGIGFFFNESSNIEISHCAVNDNNDNQGGVFLIGCLYTNIVDCNIHHNGVGVNIVNSSHILIERCDLFWNTHHSIKLRDSAKDVTIINCEIAHSFRKGISLEGSCCKIIDNNIYKNTLYGLYSKSSFCNAQYNWWGFITGPAIIGLGIADRITRCPGKILYFPWHYQPLQNIGSDWKTSDIFTKTEIPDDAHKPIVIPGNDTDQDGCPGWWEEKWGYNSYSWDNHSHLDPDDDGLNNIEECFTDQWGSNPFHKDIFLEFDWIASEHPDRTSNKPSETLIEELQTNFNDHDITLHIDIGNLGGGEELPYWSNFSYADLRDLYWNYFLHNDLNNPRKGIFHYGLVCDNGPGRGFAFIGWDHLDSFAISAQYLEENRPKFNREQLIVGGSMHELGHTLGLFVDDFGGIDRASRRDFWLYRNYKSCMNYAYVFRIMDYSDGSHGKGDFNDWDNLDFSFFKNTHFEWPKD